DKVRAQPGARISAQPCQCGQPARKTVCPCWVRSTQKRHGVALLCRGTRARDCQLLPINTRFAAASSLSFSSPTFGYANLSEARVSITAAATTTRVNHLLSAGTTYQCDSFVAVQRIVSS